MDTGLCTRTSKSARGLALVELIVVLLILALLAGTAITATQGMVEETFHDTTRTTLERIDEAILGPYAPPTAHDDTLLAGFVADVGRLPRVVGTNPELALAELWSLPTDVAPFKIQSPPGDCGVQMLGGWRGPYLHLGLGAARLVDGWGRAFVVEIDGTPALPGDPADRIARVASLGADALEGGADYDHDVEIEIVRANGSLVLRRDRASFQIRVEPAVEGGATTNCLIRVYAPARVGAIEGKVRAVDQFLFDDKSTAQTHLFPNVPVGPRVVRAYDWTEEDGAVPELDAEVIDALRPRSAPVTVLLVSGGVPEVVLKIGAPMPPCLLPDSR